jgi:hypothetical protein
VLLIRTDKDREVISWSDLNAVVANGINNVILFKCFELHAQIIYHVISFIPLDRITLNLNINKISMLSSVL